VSAWLARPPASLLPLTPVQLVIVAKIAYGEPTTAIASDLSLTISSVNVQVTLSGRKLGASGRAAVVHATFATHQLPRPRPALATWKFSDQHIEAWHMVAIGATSEIYAQRARASRREVLRRVTDLREFTGAVNDPHLVTLGWAYGQLNESLKEMATGHRLRPPIRDKGRRRRGRGQPTGGLTAVTPPSPQHQQSVTCPAENTGGPHRPFPFRADSGELDG
jgi:DNA-binding CsgD family transcriptional regulator